MYSDVALLARDLDFTARVTAAYASESLTDPDPANNPEIWTRDHSWEVAAQPGFGDAYASALAGSVVRPGNDPSVISDAQILSAVQSIITVETPPEGS
jgi:hypothetical protein